METTFPLHPAQYDVFRAQLIDTESPLYNVGAYVKLKGPLVKEKFNDAVRSAPQVFDAFRMRFQVNEAEAVCYFEAGYEAMEITELDFSDVPFPAEEAERWMKRRFNVAFAIQTEKLLFENVLLKIAADEHWFFMRYHHLIMDGYGFKVWLQYLARKYYLLVSGQNTQFCHPLYANEIKKANEYTASSFYRLEGHYWKERITEKPKKILQSRDYNNQRWKASTFHYNLSDPQRRLLEYLQGTSRASVQHLTIAALLIYFGKTTGVSDIVLGIPLHKRESKQMRNVVGMFSSILPFKAIYQPDAKLIDFLAEIMLLLKKDFRRKNYLMGDISRDLQINPGSETLYDIIVNYETLFFELNFSDEIQATVIQLSSDYERIPLQLWWQDFGNNQPLQLQVVFREDYFTQKEIVLLTQRIFFILEQFPMKLEAEIGNIDIVLPDEVQTLQSFNKTTVNYPCERSLVDLFELQVAKTPDRAAVSFDEMQLTYQQLNEKANQLAHYLREKGVKDQALVPICIERSLEMIIGMIGILKAGGTYVPIDPAYPSERIHYILEDTEAEVILTSTLSQTRLPSLENVGYILPDKEWPLITVQPRCNLELQISTSALVYVIYTSGSTGKPKGVQMPGANLVNLLMWQEQQFKNTLRHVLQFASLNFDVSFQEIFSTLCFGSSLYLIRERQRSDMSELSGAISQYGITHLFLPCVVLKSLAEHINTNSIRHLPLETIIVAGEQLQLTNDIKQWLESSSITLTNQYGPTEAHVVSSYTIDHHNASSSLPPIGKPISNTCLFILDSQCRLLPPGIAGEIFITGAGVARGYLNNEELTSIKFIDNPFGEGKMYRTGDIGRWLPDGNLEFLGRMDDQVKIRGHRIEIGEIESVLQQCSLVSHCVVMVKEPKVGAKLLVCYVVPKQNFDQNAIVAFLESKLPRYMIPSFFIPLEALPVTMNGKVDKKVLPDPDVSMLNKFVAPTTEMEVTLVKIWQDELGVKQVGIRDNFFELGGHSLLVSKTIAKITQIIGRDVPISSLFQYPTIEEYAKFLRKNLPVSSVKHIVPLKAGSSKMPLYIISPMGVAPLSRFFPFISMLDEKQPVYGLQLPEIDLENVNSVSIEGVAARYVSDLLDHDPHGPYALSGYSIGGLIAFEMAKQLKTKGKNIALLCLFDTVAYTNDTLASDTQANTSFGKLLQLYTKFKKTAYSLYHRIDNNLYSLKFEAMNTLKGKKRSLVHGIKKHLTLNAVIEEKTESELLQENILKLSMAAYKKYKLTPFDGNVILFRAKRRVVYFETSEFLGWKPYVKSIKVYEIEGNHYSIFNPAHCRQLATLVQKCLNDYKGDAGYRHVNIRNIDVLAE